MSLDSRPKSPSAAHGAGEVLRARSAARCYSGRGRPGVGPPWRRTVRSDRTAGARRPVVACSPCLPRKPKGKRSPAGYRGPGHRGEPSGAPALLPTTCAGDTSCSGRSTSGGPLAQTRLDSSARGIDRGPLATRVGPDGPGAGTRAMAEQETRTCSRRRGVWRRAGRRTLRRWARGRRATAALLTAATPRWPARERLSRLLGRRRCRHRGVRHGVRRLPTAAGPLGRVGRARDLARPGPRRRGVRRRPPRRRQLVGARLAAAGAVQHGAARRRGRLLGAELAAGRRAHLLLGARRHAAGGGHPGSGSSASPSSSSSSSSSATSASSSRPCTSWSASGCGHGPAR